MELDQNTPITLNLNLAKTNQVLGALGTQPYDRVAGLIAEIQQQAAPQLMAAQQSQAVVAEAAPESAA